MATGEEIDMEFYGKLQNFREDMKALLMSYKMGVKFKTAQKLIDDNSPEAYDKTAFRA